MKLAKEVYRYIEYELYHYEDYKKELLLERERIIESSPGYLSGMPRRSDKSDVTYSKAVRLTESTAVLSLERRIKAVEKTLSRLSGLHGTLFYELYTKARKDYVKLCLDLNISRETLTRYKTSIIIGVGNELGIVNL